MDIIFGFLFVLMCIAGARTVWTCLLAAALVVASIAVIIGHAIIWIVKVARKAGNTAY